MTGSLLTAFSNGNFHVGNWHVTSLHADATCKLQNMCSIHVHIHVLRMLHILHILMLHSYGTMQNYYTTAIAVHAPHSISTGLVPMQKATGLSTDMMPDLVCHQPMVANQKWAE